MSEITWKENRVLPVALTDDEKRVYGQTLAHEVQAYQALQAEHATDKKAMKDAEEDAEASINALAKKIESGVEDRVVEVEVRANPTEGVIREVRTDTGELADSRAMTEGDKDKAKAHAQERLPGTS